MFPKITKEVELHRGYVDSEGKAHKRVVLRPPTVDDEIKRDSEMNELTSQGNIDGLSETLARVALVKQCIVKWDTIPKPELHHLRALSRADGRLLMKAFFDIEDEDEKLQMGNETSSASSS